jgi:hypothetical protein
MVRSEPHLRLIVTAAVAMLMLSACGGAQTSTSPTARPPASTSSPTQTPLPSGDTRDYSDFAVAQDLVQESIDALQTSGIGGGSEGLAKLQSALGETSPTESWCTGVQAGVDALNFARLVSQARTLQSAADAQGC